MKPLRVFLTLLIPLLAGIGLSLLLNPGDQLTDPGPTISQSTRADSLDAEVIAPQPIDQNDPLTDSLLPTTWIPSSQEEVVLFLHGIRSLRDVGGHFNMNLANVLLAGVSSREPQLVLELLLEPESEPLHRSCLPTLLNVWAANDL